MAALQFITGVVMVWLTAILYNNRRLRLLGVEPDNVNRRMGVAISFYVLAMLGTLLVAGRIMEASERDLARMRQANVEAVKQRLSMPPASRREFTLTLPSN